MIKWFLILIVLKILVDLIIAKSQYKILFCIGVVVEYFVCLKIISFFITDKKWFMIAAIIIAIIGVFNCIVSLKI